MLYEYLDYPKLPIELESMCLDFKNLEFDQKWPIPKNLDKIDNKHTIDKFAKYKQYMVPKEVIYWLHNNGLIDRNIRMARIHCMFDGPRVHPHFDYPRTLAINYLLTESTATTCFYKHKTKTNLIPRCVNEVFDLEDLELFDSVVLEHHRWHRLDVTKIHNVEDITVPRIAITLSDK